MKRSAYPFLRRVLEGVSNLKQQTASVLAEQVAIQPNLSLPAAFPLIIHLARLLRFPMLAMSACMYIAGTRLAACVPSALV